MTTGQKASISLLLGVILFAGFAVLGYSGLFGEIELRFYNPRIARAAAARADNLAAGMERWRESLDERFSAIVALDAVKRAWLPNQAAEDIAERDRAFGLLAEATPGFLGARVLDADGRRLHYSGFEGDVLRRESFRTVYRAWGDQADRPYAAYAVRDGSGSNVFIDAPMDAVAFAYRFSDEFGVERGVAVFWVSRGGLAGHLTREGILSVGEAPVFAGEAGVLAGVPAFGREELPSRVAEAWSGGLGAEPVPVAGSEVSGDFVLFTSRGTFLRAGFLAPASWFRLPGAMRLVLLGAVFVTVFLVAFLVLNLRQDPLVVVADRVKRFQIGLVEEYLEREGELDLRRWRAELESRRAEARAALRRKLGKVPKKREAELDGLVDKGWSEILAVLDARLGGTDRMDARRLEELLGKALSGGNIVVAATPAPARAEATRSGARAALAPPDAIDEAEDLESLEASAEVGDLEEAEELAEAGELEEAEDLEAAEELAEVEALEAAEAPVEPEKLEQANAPEEAEALEELEEAEALEEFEEAEALEELEEAEELEELETEDAALATEEIPEDGGREAFEDLAAFVEKPSLTAWGDVAPADQLEELLAGPADEGGAGSASIKIYSPIDARASESASSNGSEPPVGASGSAAVGDDGIDELEELEAYPEDGDGSTIFDLQGEDEVPVIPESIGLELVDEAAIEEILALVEGAAGDEDAIDVEAVSLSLEDDQAGEAAGPFGAEGYAGRAESTDMAELEEAPESDDFAELEEVPEIEARSVSGGNSATSEPGSDTSTGGSVVGALSNAEVFVDATGAAYERREAVENGDAEEFLDEAEYEIYLSSLDLSGLEGWREEAGFSAPRPADALAELAADAAEQEADDSAIRDGEIPMLSDEERERVEELPTADAREDEAPTDAMEVSPSYYAYRSPECGHPRFRTAAEGEIEAIGGEDAVAAAFAELLELGELEERMEGEAEDTAAPAEGGFIVLRDGIFQIEAGGARPGVGGDPKLKALADAVLRARRR